MAVHPGAAATSACPRSSRIRASGPDPTRARTLWHDHGVRFTIKSLLSLIVALLAVCTFAYAWLQLSPRRVPEGQPPLTRLRADSLPAFRDAINASEGEVRVIAMLSPT